jgi:hypothetical protein
MNLAKSLGKMDIFPKDPTRGLEFNQLKSLPLTATAKITGRFFPRAGKAVF